MNLLKICSAAALVSAVVVSANTADEKLKRQFKNNMMVVTNVTPKNANDLLEVFTEGVFYGRARMNSFMNRSTYDHEVLGVGASLVYKTAPLYGISSTLGLYGAYVPNLVRPDEADTGNIKQGHDLFSRYDVASDSNWYMVSLAEVSLEYTYSKTKAIAGRQIFESFLTKSNDTKMIPNTFEGFVLETKDIPDTRVRGAYFTAQKLRDHTTFHDVITFKDSAGAKWNGNDDAAVHKGLSHANFTAAKAAGLKADTSHELIVVDASNKSIKGLQVDVTYGSVTDVVSSITGEVNYKISLGDSMTLTPGVRYMHQIDNGGGAIGGASLSGNVNATNGVQSGYTNGGSLDSSLLMARLTLKDGPLKAQVGYSSVADEADIIAPWRGFPTGGYTRAMAQYNWRANTQTICAEVNYDFGKAGLVPGFSALARYAMQDFDENKQGTGGVQADSNILHMDFRETITPNLYAKIRVGLVSANEREGSTDKDSYNEYRFELNYLF